MGASSNRAILAHEFTAQEGSFLLEWRTNRYWDKEAFERVTQAMRICCQEYSQPIEQGIAQSLDDEHEETKDNQSILTQLEGESPLLPRWLVEGFWYFSTMVPTATMHPYWQPIIDQEPIYYQKAFKRLEGLAWWFFTGACLWQNEDNWWDSTTL